MAVDLVITLTDEEATTVSGWLDIIQPGMDGPTKIETLQGHARNLLHSDLVQRVRAKRQKELQAQMDALMDEMPALPAVLPVGP